MTIFIKQAEVPVSEVTKDGKRIEQFIMLRCDGQTHNVFFETLFYPGSEAEPNGSTGIELPLVPCDGSCQGWKNPSVEETRTTFLEVEAEWKVICDVYRKHKPR